MNFNGMVVKKVKIHDLSSVSLNAPEAILHQKIRTLHINKNVYVKNKINQLVLILLYRTKKRFLFIW